MTQPAIDLKLFCTIKDLLTKADNETSSVDSPRRTVGSFSYLGFAMPPKNACDEVFPGIWLGDASTAMKPNVLKQMNVTHVVNVSMGKQFSQTNTSSDFYKEHSIQFYGIPAMDVPAFPLLTYLRPAADFMEDALRNSGKIYVHCQQGISRSATVVLAYLMLKRNMDLVSAVRLVRQRREIYPNDGFLRQLCELSKELHQSHRGVEEVKVSESEDVGSNG